MVSQGKAGLPVKGEASEEAEPSYILQGRGLERKLDLGVGFGLGPTQFKV